MTSKVPSSEFWAATNRNSLVDGSEEFCSGLLTSGGLRVGDVKSPEQRVPSRHTRNSLVDGSEEFCSGLLTSRSLRVSDVKSPEQDSSDSSIREFLLGDAALDARDF